MTAYSINATLTLLEIWFTVIIPGYSTVEGGFPQRGTRRYATIEGILSRSSSLGSVNFQSR